MEELIDHLRLGWDLKDLVVVITMYIGFKEFPKRTGIPEKFFAEKLANALNRDYMKRSKEDKIGA